MRDFNNDGHITVQGDFTVTDNAANEHKLLIHCSSEHLLLERPFRQENIKLEQARKVKRLMPFYTLSVLLLCAAAGWATFNGKADIASFLLGGGSLYLGLLSLKLTFEPNTFQIEERNAVNEINRLLKKRRVE